MMGREATLYSMEIVESDDDGCHGAPYLGSN